MVTRIIDWSLRNRVLVLGLTVLAVVGGVLAMRRLDIDAFPDTTPVQVQINTRAPALGPEEVEQQITFPVEQAVSGLPKVLGVRSTSRFGLSQVVVNFTDETDIYFARQVISERLGSAQLPAGIERPQLGPVATGLGEIFHYILTSDRHDLTELRTIHDWTIKPAMLTVPGVAEINTWGGQEKQYHVRIDPDRLVKHNLGFDQVLEVIESNNRSAGGGSVTAAGTNLLVQGSARVTNIGEIEQMAIASKDGVPIRVKDVAEVVIGSEIRHGAVTYQGRGEAILGLGFMLMGENSHAVASRLRAKLEELKRNLPEGVRVQVVYDRTELVDHVLDTVRKNLLEGGLLVVAVLFLFLGNLRAGLIVALAIPLSMLFAFSGMWKFAIAGSLMSLGAIDFGLIVDSSVIQIENAVRHATGDKRGRPILEVVRDAVLEVRKPTLFGEMIILLVYVPILALEGVEGKLFRPMALTVIFAILGSLVLSLTVMPALASLVLSGRMRERVPLLVRISSWVYAPGLRFVMRHRWATLGLAIGALGVAVVIARGLGSEFIPRLSEGSVVINVIRLTGTSLEDSIQYNTRMERALLKALPDEIEQVWSRIGTAEVATDPMGIELTDLFIMFRPREQWKRASSQAELTRLVHRELRDMPGQRLAFSQPIEMRIAEMTAGARGDVVAKIFGDDLETLVVKAREVAGVLASIPGAADLSIEQVTGQGLLRVKADPEALARHGVPAKAVMGLVEALGGREIGQVMEGQLRFPLVARLPEAIRRDPQRLEALMVAMPGGARLPLSSVARVEQVEGPATITREWGQRRISISLNVRGRDIGSYIAEARQQVGKQVQLPPGRYRLDWGGQFEHLIRARQRLMIVVPAVLLLIFGLLYVTYRGMVDALRVFAGVPMAAVGGVVALWLRDMPFSISAAVGFVALSGVAVLADMVLVSRTRQLLERGVPLEEAVYEAAVSRLRPVLMTGLVASLGFLPMALSTGVGAEVQRPLATVVIGGMISGTLLTLLVQPAMYLALRRAVGRK